MTGTKRKIVRNTIANTLLRGSKFIINFILFPFIVYYIGIEDYGLYLLVGALVGYFGILDLGVGSAIVKYIAEYNAKKDAKKINKIVNTTFMFYLIIGIIICVSVIIVGTYYVYLFGIEAANMEKARFIAYLVAIGALTSWPLRNYEYILSGLQRYDLNATVRFSISVTNAAVTVFLLLSGYGIIDLVFWGIIIGSLGQIPSAILVQKQLPDLKIRFRFMGKDTLGSILKFSSVLFFGQIITLVVLGTDRVLLGLFVSVGAITLYEIARKLHDVVYTISGLPISAILPAASELEAEKRTKKIEKLIIRGGRYSTAVVVVFSTIIFMLASPIIRFWMGEGYTDMTLATQVYVSYWFIYAPWGLIGTVMLAQEKFRPIVALYAIVGILNLIISLLLVQRYEILGIVMGTAIPYFIIMPFLIPYGLKLMNINSRRYLTKVIFPVYPIALLTGFLIFLVNELMPNILDSIIGLILVSLMAFGVFFGLFYEVGLSRREKREILQMFSKRFN